MNLLVADGPFPQLATASDMAGEVDTLFFSMVGLSLLLLFTLYILITLFAFRYRAGNRHAKRQAEEENVVHVEILWTAVPAVAFLGLFVWSGNLYLRQQSGPPDAMDVYVVASQWMWKFEHPNGRRELNELHVPVGTPVELTLTSQDVIHSFFVPAFRLKQDVLPGRYEKLWFEATETGRFPLLCAEYCGARHSRMRATIVVQEQERFAEWLARGEPRQSLAGRGASLFLRHGCSGCHVAGSFVEAPLLAGLYGTRVRLDDGSTVVADDDYLRDAILLPDKHVVAGFPAIMPSYSGVLAERDVLALVEYLQSLQAAAPAEAPRADDATIDAARDHLPPGDEDRPR